MSGGAGDDQNEKGALTCSQVDDLRSMDFIYLDPRVRRTQFNAH